MKTMLRYLMTALLLSGSAAGTQAQDIAKADKKTEKLQRVQQLVEGKRFVFEAQTINPTGGPTRQLNSYFDLTVKEDSIVSYLPYFGRAYVAPMGTNDAGIRFTSTNFKYEKTPRKKGGWNIKILPQDVDNVQQMNLSISENGHASLQVTSNNRQPVSFMGIIKAGRREL